MSSGPYGSILNYFVVGYLEWTKKRNVGVSELQINPEPALILFVAGESLQLEHLTAVSIPECISEGSIEFTLQNAYRKAIRKCLLDIDFLAHLFNRIDRLCLPALSDHISCSIH